MKDVKEDSVELTAMMRNAQSQFQEIVKLSPALSDQVKIAALNTEDPGHFTDLIAVNLNLEPGRTPEDAGNQFRQGAPDAPPADAQSRAGSADAQFENPDRSRHVPCPKRSAIFSCANRCAPSSANWAKATPTRGEIKTLREKIEKTALPAEARKVADAGTGAPVSKCRPPPPNTASRAIIWIGF